LRLENNIAIKYILSGKEISFVKVINVLATTGIAIGVAAIIFVVSILSGFQVMNYNQILGFDPHLRVSLSAETEQNNELISFVRNSEIVNDFALTSEKKSALRSGNNIQVARLLYINPMSETYTSSLNKSLLYGELQNNSNSLILGVKLAKSLGATRGDQIELLTPEELEKSVRMFRSLNGTNMLISGVFFSNVKDYDEQQIYIIDQNPNKENLDIKLNDYEDTDTFYRTLSNRFESFSITTWKELNQDFFKIMQFEKLMTILILFLIIIISAFNILASLSMTVIQKRKDIAILRTLGLSKQRVRNIFRNEGVIIGIIGTVAGSIIGITLVVLQSNYGLFQFGQGITIQSAFPVSYEFGVYAIVIVSSISLSLFATYLPTKRINKMSILDGIREE
jgi:lipoprotein-releasing system permease protein